MASTYTPTNFGDVIPVDCGPGDYLEEIAGDQTEILLDERFLVTFTRELSFYTFCHHLKGIYPHKVGDQMPVRLFFDQDFSERRPASENEICCVMVQMLGEQRDGQWYITSIIFHETDEHKSKYCFFCETPPHRDLSSFYYCGRRQD